MVCWKIPHLVRWFSQKYLLHSQVSFCYYLTSSHDMSIISLFSPSIYMYVYIYIYTHIQTSPLDSAIYFRTSQILYRFFNQSKISVVFFFPTDVLLRPRPGNGHRHRRLFDLFRDHWRQLRQLFLQVVHEGVGLARWWWAPGAPMGNKNRCLNVYTVCGYVYIYMCVCIQV